MKKVLVLLVVVVVALLAYNFLTTGKLSLVPGPSMSEQEQQVARLEGDLKSARTSFRQASRAAAVSGVDFTAEAAVALAEVDTIEKALVSLERNLTEEAAKQAAKQLKTEIREFKSELR